VVNIPILARQEDSTAAAAAMVKAGVGCIITLGGDGTNRAVFKGSGADVPILPVSTGTNNVFPEFQEGTTAGYAAGLVALGKVQRDIACWRSKVLIVQRNNIPVDLALVDLAVSTENVIGARAIWDATNISELFLTRAQPWSIGLSAIGGAIRFLPAEGPQGMHLKIGQGGRKIRAAIGPGLFADLSILSNSLLSAGDTAILTFDRPAALAFDGERDLIARPGEELTVQLSANGPWVVDTPRTVCAAITD
jgi:predicted polyphosphate/ATP-dependent NAD kinase